MKFPSCSWTACAAVAFFVGTCFPDFAGALPQENVRPAAQHAETALDQPSQPESTDTAIIPGPLRSFLRMAGISQEVTPEDVLPMLARNVVLYGFDTDGEKEYLILVDRYVHQARDLERLSAADGKIHISGCGDAAELLSVLGYKFQGPCGHRNTALVTG